MTKIYTREEILYALRLEPCHITGMHDPDHHLKHTCSDQRAAAFRRVLDLIGATEEELPHALHEHCGWCHRVPTQEKYRDHLRRTYEWAGVPIPAELAAPAKDAPVFDRSEDEVMSAVREAPKLPDGWVKYSDIWEQFGITDHAGGDVIHVNRPLHLLVDAGKLEFRNDRAANYSGQVRLAEDAS